MAWFARSTLVAGDRPAACHVDRTLYWTVNAGNQASDLDYVHRLGGTTELPDLGATARLVPSSRWPPSGSANLPTVSPPTLSDQLVDDRVYGSRARSVTLHCISPADVLLAAAGVVPGNDHGEPDAEFLTEPKDHGREIRAYIRDPDGHLIEVGQTTARPSPP